MPIEQIGVCRVAVRMAHFPDTLGRGKGACAPVTRIVSRKRRVTYGCHQHGGAYREITDRYSTSKEGIRQWRGRELKGPAEKQGTGGTSTGCPAPFLSGTSPHRAAITEAPALGTRRTFDDPEFIAQVFDGLGTSTIWAQQ